MGEIMWWIAIGVAVWFTVLFVVYADDLEELYRERERREALAKIVEEVRTRDRRGPSEVA
jgi:high-affinity K+ transport system ATPase subunit B